ncbi:MAG TPA: undecaprenyl-phosphate glucose phosphotransferase [Chloroflexia bacterium]|nr:undecaprenyl-phosphate glucose phosphotransferase [Chloroflexia bacterium]
MRPSNGHSNGRNHSPNRAHVMASSHAPVAEPARAGKAAPAPAPAPPPVPAESSAPAASATPPTGVLDTAPTATPVLLSPAEAEQVARTQRDERRRTQAVETVHIPSLPPLPKQPARLTPVVLVLVETVLDVLAIAGAFTTAYAIKSTQEGQQLAPSNSPVYLTMLGITVASIIVSFYLSKLYNLKRGASRVDEFYKIAMAVSIGTLGALAVSSLILGEVFNYSRQVLLTGWVLTILFVTATRLVYGVALGTLRRRGFDKARVLIVGTGPTAQVIEERLRFHSTLGYSVVGMVDPGGTDAKRQSNRLRAPILGDLKSLPVLVRKHKVDEVILAITGASDKQLRDILGLLEDETVSVKIYPDAFQLMTQNEVSVGELSGLPLLSVKDVALRGWNRRMKRAFDIVFSLIVLVFTSPFMLLLALAIKLSSPGPVFFIQERVGLDGKPFQLVKFRTMKVSAGEEDTPKLKEGMPGWTVRNDPRRTSIGTFLRRFSLDELPQFFNVLVGEMSVVGPRPEQPAYVQEFAQRIPRYLRRHREKAGLTGWAQVNGLRGQTSLQDRIEWDNFYIENWSPWLDLKILLLTPAAILNSDEA